VSAEWPELLEELEQRRAALMDSGRPKAVAFQRATNSLTARERVDALVDPGTFREYGTFATPDTDAPATRGLVAPADGVVTGIGDVGGRPAAIVSQDVTVLGGSHGTITGLKAQRMADLAGRHGIPLVMLVEGGGHRIQEALDSRHQAGGPVNWASFASLARLSGWVPVVAGVMGPSFAGPSNFAAFADYVVLVRGKTTMGIAGPSLVKGAIGEDSTAEELGSVEQNVDELGTADYGATDDADAIAAIRRFLSFLAPNGQGVPPVSAPAPAEDQARLLELVPTRLNRAYDMRKVVRVLADGGDMFEVRPTFARNVITAFARIEGRAVGIVANNPKYLAGAMEVKACEKAAHFISVCDAFGVPLVFLVDTPGLMVGKAVERTGLVRRMARVLFELSQVTVPTVSIVVRKAYGAAYLLMCGGRSFEADLCVLWPTAEIGGMNLEGSVDVAYRRRIVNSEDPVATREQLLQETRDRIGVYQGAGGFGVDEIIHPLRTRGLIAETLTSAPERTKQRPYPGARHAISPI
jgi:acetyl-CoA carboxylase carboxyltransferase component